MPGNALEEGHGVVPIGGGGDDDRPHLLTQVSTTIATDADIEQLAAIHDGLARVALLPARHPVDWFNEVPRAATRSSGFAAHAPAC